MNTPGGWTRRSLIELALALGLTVPIRLFAQSSTRQPEKLRPQPGDRLVFATGSREGDAVKPDDLALGAEPLGAYPMDRSSGVVRNGSRLNQVMVLRLDPTALSPETAGAAADGIVAYSAVCTHTGCEISQWRGKERHLVCPCHGSEFDAADAALVVKGPAPKPLAMLPLEIAEGELRVKRGFTSHVGFQPQ